MAIFVGFGETLRLYGVLGLKGFIVGISHLTHELSLRFAIMGFKDLVFGTTIESVRHKVKIPVLIVRNN